MIKQIVNDKNNKPIAVSIVIPFDEYKDIEDELDDLLHYHDDIEAIEKAEKEKKWTGFDSVLKDTDISTS